MLDFAFFIKYLTSLFAIVDPFGGIAIFLYVTAGMSIKQRNKVGILSGFFVACILSLAAIMGHQILDFFSISLPAFQVAGGIILLILALAMLEANRSEIKGNQAEQKEATEKENIAVFPLAIPFFAGPGAFAFTIITANNHYNTIGLISIITAIILVSILVIIVLYFSAFLAEKLGNSGLNIVTRIMGIILTAFAIEMMSDGLKGLFPILTGAAGN